MVGSSSIVVLEEDRESSGPLCVASNEEEDCEQQPHKELAVQQEEDDTRSVTCGGKSYRFRLSGRCVREMASDTMQRLKAWLLEIEMGFVWGVAGMSIIVFVFLAIWFIDPALLTLVLQFRQARCVTRDSAFLVGISNCSWTSCRLGCTREIYKCWQVQVTFEFVQGTEPYRPPWAPLSDKNSLTASDYAAESQDLEGSNIARLYPNVRGCGYPPTLNCERFYETYGAKDFEFDCWVSTMDPGIAMTELNLEQAKEEVIFSLIPLFIFILFVLYAFCRLGVFSICNPLKMCPKANDTHIEMPSLTPKKLFDYKKGLLAKKSQALASFQAAAYPPGSSVAPADFIPTVSSLENQPASVGVDIPATIEEEVLSGGSNRGSGKNKTSSGGGLSSADSKKRKNPGSSNRTSSFGSTNSEENPQRASSSNRRNRFSASSLISLVTPDHRVGTVGNTGNRRRTSNDDPLNDSFEHEVLDMKEFDLDSDDIVSIRSIRTGTTKRGVGGFQGDRAQSWSNNQSAVGDRKKDS